MAVVGAHHRVEYVLAPLIHVVFGTNRNSFHEFLWSYDMFHSVMKLFSQLAMGDKHKSDHSLTPPWTPKQMALIAMR
ncbi:hypothetical protein D3C87_2050580 [compost metagenome]